MVAEQATRIAELQQIKTALEALQASYSERLQQTETVIGKYQAELGASVSQIKADHEATLKALSERIDTAIADLQKKSAEDLAVRVAEIKGINSAIGEYQAEATKKTDEQILQLVKECERLIAEMKSEIAAQETAYAEKLQQAEQTIRGYQTEAKKKYNEFVNRLESTNVDQIFKEVQGLKQSLQTKFMILMGGIGVAVVVGTLGIILR